MAMVIVLGSNIKKGLLVQKYSTILCIGKGVILTLGKAFDSGEKDLQTFARAKFSESVHRFDEVRQICHQVSEPFFDG
jgi:hypothetical protein